VEAQCWKVRARKKEWRVFGRIVKFFMHKVDCGPDGPPGDRFQGPRQGVLDSGPNWVKMKCPSVIICGPHLEKLVERMSEWDATSSRCPQGKRSGFRQKEWRESSTRTPATMRWCRVCTIGGRTSLHLPLEAPEDGMRHMVHVTQRMGLAQEVALHGPRHKWPAPELHGFLKDKGLEDKKTTGGAFLGTLLICAGLPKIPWGDTYDRHLKSGQSLPTVNQP